MKKHQRLAVSLVVAWLSLATGSPAFAARLLSAIIQLNGQTVLQSSYQDDRLVSLE